jgi:carnitine 3-dehydrogenase
MRHEPVRTDVEVPAAWTDYNGHLTDGFYAPLFTEATNAVLDALDAGEDYQRRTGGAYFTAESHLRYLAEVSAGEAVHIDTTIVGADTKRLHLLHELTGEDSEVRASNEVMLLHVADGQVCAAPAEVSGAIIGAAHAHRHLPRPESLGGGVRPVVTPPAL